jgi:hypothetical protein
MIQMKKAGLVPLSTKLYRKAAGRPAQFLGIEISDTARFDARQSIIFENLLLRQKVWDEKLSR